MGLIDFVLLYNVASGELLRKAFIERKCAVISPSDRIDCGYEGKTLFFIKYFVLNKFAAMS